MADNNATILIPDISGFTEFMTTTELSHSTYAINILIDAIVNAVGEEYEVSEIEGDAVLMIKKGPSLPKKKYWKPVLKFLMAFIFKGSGCNNMPFALAEHARPISNLTLKFVVHHGPLAEIKVGRFIKQSGTEMIVAHRLLKNSIDNHEYLLLTEKLLENSIDSPETPEMEWVSSSEEYSSIGKVNYRFALLTEARKNVPDPPEVKSYYTDNTPYLEIKIAANFHDVYMAVMNIPGRSEWVPGLQKVEQDRPLVFVGSIHECTFEGYSAIISPLRMILSGESIIYAESCGIKEMNLSLVHEFIFKKNSDNSCNFTTRFMNAGEFPVPDEMQNKLFESMLQMAEKLKVNCENQQPDLTHIS